MVLYLRRKRYDKKQMLAIIYNNKFANDLHAETHYYKVLNKKAFINALWIYLNVAIMQDVELSRKHLNIIIIDAQIDISLRNHGMLSTGGCIHSIRKGE